MTAPLREAPAGTPLCERCEKPLWPPPSRVDWKLCFPCTQSPRHSRKVGPAPGYRPTASTPDCMTFTVPGTPLSVNRVHRMGVTQKGKRLMYYTAEGRRFQNSVALHAASARHSDWRLDRQYEVEIVSYFASDRSDADNAVKPLLDSLQGTLFTNDKQVVRVIASKSVDKLAPRMVVTVRAI